VRPNVPVGKAKSVFQRGAAQCAGRESQAGVLAEVRPNVPVGKAKSVFWQGTAQCANLA